MDTNGQSRRGVLTRGLLAAAGALGVGAAARAAPAPTTELRLHGTSWRLDAPGRRRGEQIRRGDHGTVHGELLDAPGRTSLGRFFGSRMAVQSAPGGHVRADASVEVHTFVLRDGTILGMGTSLPGESLFAIVGGTGAYTGASGSYSAVQRLHELGGDGTADFHLTIRRPEA